MFKYDYVADKAPLRDCEFKTLSTKLTGENKRILEFKLECAKSISNAVPEGHDLENALALLHAAWLFHLLGRTKECVGYFNTGIMFLTFINEGPPDSVFQFLEKFVPLIPRPDDLDGAWFQYENLLERHNNRNKHPELHESDDSVDASLAEQIADRIKSEIRSWSENECAQTEHIAGRFRKIAQTNLSLGHKYISEQWKEICKTDWTRDAYLYTQTDVLHFRWVEFADGREMLLGYSISCCNDGGGLDGPVYIDLESAAKDKSNIELTSGIIGWMLSGGIWAVPLLTRLTGQFTEAVIDAVRFADTFSGANQKIMIGASELAKIAVEAVLWDENRICDTVFLKNGKYDSSSFNPEEIKEANVFYVCDEHHMKEVYRIGADKNHFVSFFWEPKPSILDHDLALAFAIKRSVAYSTV